MQNDINDITKTLCFTGHRPDRLGGYDTDNAFNKEIKKQMLDVIIDSYVAGYRNFISGMALGVDTWGAILILGLREQYPDINLITAVPFEGQERMWKDTDKKTFHLIRQIADKDVVVSEGGYHVSKMQIRNKWMVDHSNLVLAVWDGNKGGTANCVKYARSKHKILVQINPDHYKDKNE